MSPGSTEDMTQGLFRSAFDTFSDNVVILDSERTIATTNSPWLENDGKNETPELSGVEYLHAIEGVTDRYATRAADGLVSLFEGEQPQFELEYPYQSSDGGRWILLRARPFTHEDERCVIVTHTDITDRKQRERALRDAYEISTTGGLSFSDRIADLLEIAREMLGTEFATLSRVEDTQYVFEAVTSARDSDIAAGDTVPLAELPNCEHVVETQKTVVFRDVPTEAPELADSEWGIESYLGTPVTVGDEIYGTFCFYSMDPRDEAFSQWEVTFIDLLSKWVSYELERRNREEKLQHLRETVSDVVWMSDPEKNEIEFISDSYEDVWGRPTESLQQDPMSFIAGIHPNDRDRVRQALAEQQVRPDEYEETYRVVQPDGEIRWVRDHSSGVYVDGELQRIIGIGTDITDRKEREQELAYQSALLEAQAETTIDGLLVVDSDRTVRYHNDRFLDVWGISEEVGDEISDETLLETVRDRLVNPAPFFERVEYLYDHPKEQSRDTIELADGRWLDRYSAPVIGDDGTYYGRLWAFRDITERKENEQALQQQRDELLQLQRVNTLVRQSIQALQDTTSREEIETAVCEAFTESDLYQSAWIADLTETAPGEQTIRPQTVVGINASYLDGIAEYEDGPAVTAVRTGEVQVINDVATATAFPDERREIALDHDHHTLAAVPLTKTDTTYGVLVLYAPLNHTISEKEQDILTDLGRIIALALQRVHSQRSLTAETVVSLDLRIPDTEFVFGELSTELDCELSLERRVAADDGATIYYLSVDGAGPTAVRDRLRANSLITACTVVRDDNSSHPTLIEARLDTNPVLPLDVLTDYGANVITAKAVDGDITLRVELPTQVDIRTALTAVREVAPDIELVSKRHVNRPTKTASTMQNQVIEQLTDKQEAALKTAYARGYYSWPRESTMEELAETFEISSPTLHYRLRKAHDAIIGAVMDPRQVCDDST